MSENTPNCPFTKEIALERAYAQAQESARPELANTYRAGRMFLARMERRHVATCAICLAEDLHMPPTKSREAA